MKDLQYLLIGMVVSNAGSMFAVKVSKIVVYRLKKWLYFRNVKKRAAVQKQMLHIGMQNKTAHEI